MFGQRRVLPGEVAEAASEVAAVAAELELCWHIQTGPALDVVLAVLGTGSTAPGILQAGFDTVPNGSTGLDTVPAGSDTVGLDAVLTDSDIRKSHYGVVSNLLHGMVSVEHDAFI